jgi:hypothetical protein
MNTATKTFEKALHEYLQKVQEDSDNTFKKEYPKTWARGEGPKFTQKNGPRWVKIFSTAPGSNSIFCFIDPHTGDIYKPAGVNAPAKGIRGNIYNESLPLTSGSMYRYR